MTTAVYPGFPTDLQPQWCVLSALSDGSSLIKDTVFPSRFDHMAELKKLGIRYREIEGGVVIEGVCEGQCVCRGVGGGPQTGPRGAFQPAPRGFEKNKVN